MPRYDYECQTCHHLFELKQSFDSSPVATCPQCQNDANRKFSVVPIVFKGSGFYVNDYGRGSNGSKANRDKESAESKKSEKSESKSEKKSDSSSKKEAEASASSSKEKGD